MLWLLFNTTAQEQQLVWYREVYNREAVILFSYAFLFLSTYHCSHSSLTPVRSLALFRVGVNVTGL